MIEITAGFLPLTDSAILVAARELGFAEQEGIALNLVRETSWANIRDRLAVGQFEVAHTLAPMPIAANLGLTPFDVELIAPMALGLGGNAVTVSCGLWTAISDNGQPSPGDPALVAGKLAEVVYARKAAGKKRLQFAVVHPHSGHNLELRYWLASAGIIREVDIVILPPPLMADALAGGQVDGYCVGEPWNTAAVVRGVGHIATFKSAIWASSPEKVLSVRAGWARSNTAALDGLLRAMYRAADWCGSTENHASLATLLAQEKYLDRPVDQLLPGISGSILIGRSEENPIDFFEPFARAATFPWQSHALWFYSQMVRWRQLKHLPEKANAARRSYRPDIYRKALEPIGAATPSANAKVEGALKVVTAVGAADKALYLGPDGFFDGQIFDPDKLDEYITAQRLSDRED